MYTIAIIGSFQKYYSEILNIINIFKKAGLYILSPKESSICGKVKDFVIFDSDRKDFTPEEIQMITLRKIINADIVYVYNPGGYVGKTTCYEIGFCFSRKKSIYYYDYPDDLPIPVLGDKQVLKPDELIEILRVDKPCFETDFDLCPDGKKAFLNLFDLDNDEPTVKAQNIVICGSMLFYEEMNNCKEALRDIGLTAIIPQEENEIVNFFDEKQFIEFKKKVSRAYLRKIRSKNTSAVLIYNAPKNGVPNYIGANTLVELAMAFTWNRKIFLYNDIYSPLKDELQAWNCICLHGNLDAIKKVLFVDDTNDDDVCQLSLFDY